MRIEETKSLSKTIIQLYSGNFFEAYAIHCRAASLFQGKPRNIFSFWIWRHKKRAEIKAMLKELEGKQE